MRILFSMRHSGALRNFASTVEELARRGHSVHLTFMMQDKLRDERLLQALTRAHPGITHGFGDATRRPWLRLARRIRSAADYARYRAPEYSSATALHDRAAAKVPPTFQRALRLPLVRTHTVLRLLTRVLHGAEQAIPPDEGIATLIQREAPDVVLVTPLIELGSDQVEYVKAARAAGVPCGLCVHSWDNLTNKGLIHVAPDRVFVWNEAQRREATSLHGVSAERVVVTGAPPYDQWFARRPSTTRAEFCAKVGLPSEQPFFLYLCSSKFITPREAEFVKRWVQALRSASDARVRAAAVLVRPHPRGDNRGLTDFDGRRYAHVVVWPAGGDNPIDESSRNDYFDSLYHAAAAVGINTSAQIEAGIAGRSVYSIRAREYMATQEGTLHFHHLLSEHGGLLHMADSLEEHVRALPSSLDQTADDDKRLRDFIEGFVRPHGLEVAATPLLADAIERLARVTVSAQAPASAWRRLVRSALYGIAIRMKTDRPAATRRAPEPAGSPKQFQKKSELVH
jgi:hypothetical protein